MSSASNAEPAVALDPQAGHPTAPSATRPLYWSMRRELWEYRSAYIAPLIVAGIVLFGCVIRMAGLPQRVRAAAVLPPLAQGVELDKPLAIAAVALFFTGLVVSVFYCLGALNNERRDRSILFWKSLPVSDLTTVLAKACMPLLVLPAAVFAVTIATQLIMLVLGSAVLAANGLSPATLWTHWPAFKMALVLIYGLVVTTLWYAPIYGWLLVVSGWAKRMAFLWAVLPPLGLAIIERIGFDTSYVSALLSYRMKGFFYEGFAFHGRGSEVVDPFVLLTPLKFVSAPGLWLGLLAAAGFLALAVWLRRRREPI